MTAGARWVRFNLVGLLGFGVQAGFLWAFVTVFAVPAPIAVALAVFATVSHNFAWHERFTWPGSSREGRWKRWLAFNATTGALSIAANVAITTLVVRATGLPIVAANLLTVALLSLANFAVCDLIFHRIVQSRTTRKHSEIRVCGSEILPPGRWHLLPPAHAKTGLISRRT